MFIISLSDRLFGWNLHASEIPLWAEGEKREQSNVD